MARNLKPDESLNNALETIQREQNEALDELLTTLKSAYNTATIEKTGTTFTIDINPYLQANKDTTYNQVKTDINTLIDTFVASKSDLNLKHKNDGARFDGRRKFKRSRSKKSIKSKRKY